MIKTDHNILKHFLNQRPNTPFQQKWVAKLLGFDYEIQYKQGVDNSVANALSGVYPLYYLTIIYQVPDLVWSAQPSHIPILGGWMASEGVLRMIYGFPRESVKLKLCSRTITPHWIPRYLNTN